MNISTALLLYGPRRKKSSSDPVFYAPLSSAAATASTGQTMTATGSPVAASAGGVYFQDNSSFSGVVQAGNIQGVTLSAAFYSAGSDGMILGIGNADVSQTCCIWYYGGNICAAWYGSTGSLISIEQGVWTRIVLTLTSDGMYSLYFNESLVDSGSAPASSFAPNFYIGGFTSSYFSNAVIADARIFNRVISTAEIAAESARCLVSPVFYAPLSAASSTAATGQTLTATGSPTYTTKQGVPCVYFDGSSALEVSPVSAITLGRGDKTISLFFRTAADASAYEAIAYIGDTGRTASGCFGLFAYPGGGIDLSIVDTECQTTGAAYTSWTHVAGVYSGSALKLYVNGTLSQTLSGTLSLVTDRFTLGKQTADGDPYTGYLAEVKVWNRALSDAEIAAESSRCLAMVAA